MTREEQIEFAAYNEGKGAPSFIRGVKWADEHPESPWQPVRADNLPPVGTKFLLKSNKGIHRIAHMLNRELTKQSPLSDYFDDNGLPLIRTDEGTCWKYWMPIPKLKEG